MSLVPSLLQAIVRVDGEALVMHVGEKPYVIAPSGQVDLAAKGLTLEAVTGIVSQLLPPEALAALDDLGATQHELAPLPEFTDQRFTVTAARGGDDLWAEIRRRQIADEIPVTVVPLEVPLQLVNQATREEVADALVLPPEDQLWPGVSQAVVRPTPFAATEFDTLPTDPTLHQPEAQPESGSTDPWSLKGATSGGATNVAHDGLPAVALPAAAQLESSLESALGTNALWAVFPESRETGREVSPAEPEGERVVDWSFDPGMSAPASDALWATGQPERPSVTARPPAVDPGLDLAAAFLLPTDIPWKVASTGASAVSMQPEIPVPDPIEALGEMPPASSAAFGHRGAGEPMPFSLVASTPFFEPEPVAQPMAPAAAAAEPPIVAPASLPGERAAEPSVILPPAAEPIGEFQRPFRPDFQSAPPAGDVAPFVAESRETARPLVAAVQQSAVVLPIDRGTPRSDAGWHTGEVSAASLEKLVRLALGRGATALILSSNARPAVRIDGEIQTLDGLPTLSAGEIEATLLAALPERHASALRMGQPSEWVWDLTEVGRVRCSLFTDHVGPGAVCRVFNLRPMTGEALGLSPEIQALSAESEGLIIVSGPRGAGKSSVVAALVDLINRSRRDYVIAFEREINLVHARQAAFVSQRELRGSADDVASAARSALREDPDVMVFDELSSAALMDVALDAAQAGRLVIAGVRAPHVSATLDRLVDMQPSERRRHVLSSLAQNLRAVVAQVLVKKSMGGRVAAREVLFHSPLVTTVLAEGKMAQLPMAIEGGRRQGMVLLNDALAGFVQSGTVDVREAHRHAYDRVGLLDVLRRQGVDTSPVERLA